MVVGVKKLCKTAGTVDGLLYNLNASFKDLLVWERGLLFVCKTKNNTRIHLFCLVQILFKLV